MKTDYAVKWLDLSSEACSRAEQLNHLGLINESKRLLKVTDYCYSRQVEAVKKQLADVKIKWVTEDHPKDYLLNTLINICAKRGTLHTDKFLNDFLKSEKVLTVKQDKKYNWIGAIVCLILTCVAICAAHKIK